MGRVISLVGMCLLAVVVVRGAEQANPDKKRVEFIDSGFRDARERLRQFELNSSWEEILPVRDAGLVEVKTTIHCWRDFAMDRIRFDRKDVYPKIPTQPDKFFSGTLENRYVSTPEYTIFAPFGVPGAQATVMPPHEPCRFETFDVRCIGIAMPQELQNQRTYQINSNFIWREQALIDIAEEDHLVRVRWQAGEPSFVQRTIWFNEKEGFSPVRFECSNRSDADAEWDPPRYIMAMKWVQKAEVWLPAHWESIDHIGRGSIRVAFDWKSVNAPLDDRLFTYEGISLDPGTMVVDARLGNKPIIVAVIGQSSPDALQPVSTRPILLVLAAAGCTMAAVVAIALIYRRAARRRMAV